MIFAWRYPELLLEAGGEVGQRAESRQVRYLRNGIFSFLEQFGGTVQLVGLEEDAGILARQSLHLVVELGAGDFQQLGHARHVQFRVGKFGLHQAVEFGHEGVVLRGEHVLCNRR